MVEAGYSKIFTLAYAPGAAVAEAVAEAQARFPAVPIVFCENRAMAQEWTYRWLGACLDELRGVAATVGLEETFARALLTAAEPPVPSGRPAEIRAWARDQGLAIPDRGRIPAEILDAYARAH